MEMQSSLHQVDFVWFEASAITLEIQSLQYCEANIEELLFITLETAQATRCKVLLHNSVRRTLMDVRRTLLS